MLILATGPQGPIPPAPPASAPTLGAHQVVSQDNSGVGTNPMNSASMTTQAHSSILCIRLGVTNDDVPPTDNYGNTYVKIGNSIPYAGQSQYQMSAYLCANAVGGAGHIIHFAKSTNPTSESSALIVEIVGSTSHQIANNYPTTSPGTGPSLTTTGAALLVAVWSGDGDQTNTTMSCTSGSPFADLDKMMTIPTAGAVQCADATCTQSAAGTYACTWTWSPTQGAGCYLVSFQ